MTWLEENEDATKEKINEVKQVFEHNTKSLMYKVFTRKKQLDLKSKYKQSEADACATKEETEQYITNMFSDMHTGTETEDKKKSPLNFPSKTPNKFIESRLS